MTNKVPVKIGVKNHAIGLRPLPFHVELKESIFTYLEVFGTYLRKEWKNSWKRVKMTTLMFLIKGESLIRGEGGIFQRLNKQGGIKCT